MQTKNIKQSAILPCTPKKAYDAWLDSKTHSKMVHGKAVIDPTMGGLFSIWDNYLIGKTTKLDSEKLKIEQEWRDDSTDWPAGYYSKITLEFEAYKDNQTKLLFSQSGIPEQYADDIANGWKEYYWKPMQEYFQNLH